jgi:hypothetical protein
MKATGADLDAMFAEEVARVRGTGAMGTSGRVFDLFEYLVSRGAAARAATQADLADFVFGQNEVMADDATVRVYIHRLRKKLDDFYGAHRTGKDGVRLTLPSGSYALRLVTDEGEVEPLANERAARRYPLPILAAALTVTIVVGLLIGRLLPHGDQAPPANAIWQPLLDSPRPILVVLGDYYMFGEIDSVSPEDGRLVRDFRVNSPQDLELMQDLRPDRYAMAEDFGINYLPFSTAYGLERILPVLSRRDRRVSVIAASDLEPDMLNYFNVVYVGLLSGMRLLEEETFAGSALKIGESYDEIVHAGASRTYVSEEARRVTSSVRYRDYAFVSRYRTLAGALVVVVAGARDTGLRGIAPLATAAALPKELATAASSESFEALYEVTGQGGADLSRRNLFARQRDVASEASR